MTRAEALARSVARPLPAEAPPLRLAWVRAEGRSLAGVAGTVLFGLLLVAVLGVVVFQALLVQTQSRLDGLERDLVAEQRRADDLRLTVAELQSPERIAQAAEERLGMIEPGEVLYLQHDADDDARAVLTPDEEAAENGR